MMTDARRRTHLPGRCEGEEGTAKYTFFLKGKSCESDTDGAKLASETLRQFRRVFLKAFTEERRRLALSWKHRRELDRNKRSQLLAFIPKSLLGGFRRAHLFHELNGIKFV